MKLSSFLFLPLFLLLVRHSLTAAAADDDNDDDDDNAAECPEDYEETGNSCYKMSSSAASWEDSKTLCEADGAHLATVTSTHEHDTVYGITSYERVWIGLEEVNGTWQWITGEPMNYTNWYIYRPKSYQCASFGVLGWIDGDCSNGQKYMCEKSIISLSTVAPTITTTAIPSGIPSVELPDTPTSQPTGQPSGQPTGHPSYKPSPEPSGEPTSEPSTEMTPSPTGQPSGQPTTCPTGSEPSAKPSTVPTPSPTGQPTGWPTGQPSGQPTADPSSNGTDPSGDPSAIPSVVPSSSLSSSPTGQPSACPTGRPSGEPSSEPSAKPSTVPTPSPTGQPSGQPTADPSSYPSVTRSTIPSTEPTTSRLCCLSMDLASVEQYNVDHNLIIAATVKSSMNGFLVWSIGGMTSSALGAVALTPIRMAYDDGLSFDIQTPVNLVLPPHVLEAGLTYTIQLSFIPLIDGVETESETVISSIEVLPNSVPQPGTFQVFPGVGVRLVDHFLFNASHWTSHSLPLSYSFGFQSVSSGQVVPLSSLMLQSEITSVLPQGNKQNGYELTCTVRVIDTFAARSDGLTSVRVTSGNRSLAALTTILDDISGENVDSDVFNSLFGPVLESITEVNCSSAPNCFNYNRLNCSAVAHTCGPCLSKELYFGEAGHHNSRCAPRRDDEDGQNMSCSGDISCPAFHTCQDGNCATVPKQCPASCSGQGRCRHVVRTSGKEFVSGHMCEVGDTSCTVECACAVGWFGRDCSRSRSQLTLESTLHRQATCLLAVEVARSSLRSTGDIRAWIDQLSLLSQEPYKFIHETAMCSLTIQARALELMMLSPSSLSFDTIQGLLDSTATIMDYHYFFDYINQTSLQKADRLGMLKSILKAYCELVSRVMVVNQFPFQSTKARLRVLSSPFDQSITQEGITNKSSPMDLKFTTSEQEDYNDVKAAAISLFSPSNSGMCLISVDSIVYKDFSDDLELKSNTLMVMSLLTDEIDESDIVEESFTLFLEDVVDINLLATLPRTIYNISCTSDNFGSTLNVNCPYNKTHEFLCSEDSIGVWEVACPSVTPNMTCASIRPESTGLVPDTSVCTVNSILGSSIECLCPARALYPGEFIVRSRNSVSENGTSTDHIDVMDVEFTAMVSFVVEDFVDTWSSVGDLSPAEIEQSKAALLTVAGIVILVSSGLWLTNIADKKDAALAAKKSKKKLHANRVRPLDSDEKMTMKGNVKATIDINAFFPSFVSDEPFVNLFYKEMKKSHRWVSIYYSYDENFPRSMRFLLLVSVLICTLFFSAVLYNISDPDDGSCDNYETRGTCLHEPSQFSSMDTKCYWRDGTGDNVEGQCHFKEASSVMTIMYVSMMSAVLAVPFLIVYEYVIIDILCRPTAVSTANTRQVTPSARRKNHGSSMLDSAALANEDLRNLVRTLLLHFRNASTQEREELESLWGLTVTHLEVYLSSPHAANIPSRSTPQTWNIHSKNAVRPSSFTDADFRSGVEESVTCGHSRPGLMRRTINMLRGVDMLSVFEDVLGDIIITRAIAEKESLILASLTPEQQGQRLLTLFQKDLLANVSGEIVEKKSLQGKTVSLKPVSKWKQVLGYMFIATLDMGLLLYILLFAVKQDRTRQMAWIFSYIVWLILEVVVVSSLVMLMSEFAVPSLMLSEFKTTKDKMIKAIYSYQAKLLSTSTSQLVEPTDFNSAPYFYVAWRLAEKFPQSLESKIIRNFNTSLPKRTYVHIKNAAMDMYRKQLRLTALTLMLLSLERCVYDLVCWAIIGFFILSQMVIFRERPSLAITIYSCGLIIGGMVWYSKTKLVNLNRNTESKSGIISIQTMSEESCRAQQIVHDVVARLGRQRPGKKNNQKFKRIVASLRNTTAYRNGKASDVFPGRESVEHSDHSNGERHESNEKDNQAVDSSFIKRNEAKFDNETQDHDQDSSDSSSSDENRGLSDILSRRLENCQSGKDLGSVSASSESNAVGSSSEDSNGSDDNDDSDNKCGERYSSSDSDDPEGVIIDDSGRNTDRIEGIDDLNKSPLIETIVDTFSKPLKRDTLATRIRRNRHAVQQIGLKKQAQSIEDSFVLNFERRRSSIAANHLRAQEKLQQRIAEKSAFVRGEEEKVPRVVPIRRLRSQDECSGHRTNDKDTENASCKGDSDGPKTIAKMSSFDVFSEKKAMMKNYAGHQALRNRSLEAQRQAAKFTLKKKLVEVKGKGRMGDSGEGVIS